MAQDWRDSSYLRTGNDSQRRVYDVLVCHRVVAILQNFDPAVVSTICVGFDLPASDVDVICYAPNLSELEQVLRDNYSAYETFCLRYCPPNGETLVCSLPSRPRVGTRPTPTIAPFTPSLFTLHPSPFPSPPFLVPRSLSLPKKP